MYLRALDNTSSRCSATVSLVMRGRFWIASVSLVSAACCRRIGSLGILPFSFLGTLNLATDFGALSLGTLNLVFLDFFFIITDRDRSGVVLARRDTLLTQDTKQLFLNLRRMMHFVYHQVPHKCLHHYCTKSEQ